MNVITQTAIHQCISGRRRLTTCAVWKVLFYPAHPAIALCIFCIWVFQVRKLSIRKTFYNSYIPLLDYCTTLWGNATTSERIYKLQRRAAKIITYSEYRAPSDPLLGQLNWLPLPERVKYRQSELVYKAANGLAPDYMRALFTAISNFSTRTTRSNERGDLYVPRARTNVSKNAIAVNGAHIWRELYPIIRNSNSLCL